MNTEFRNRAFLPVLMPLAILGAIGLLVGAFAVLLLYVNREAAIALAIAGAAGVLVAASLAASKEKTDAGQKVAVAIAGLVPILAGVLVAVGVIGDIAEEDLNINRQPHGPTLSVPGITEGAPVLAAVDALSFCLPAGGDCTPTKEWEFSYDAEAGVVTYAFDNRNAGVDHNLFIFQGEGIDLSAATEEFIPLGQLQNDPELLITPAQPNTFPGPAAETYEWTLEAEQTLEGPAYFVCTIHPTTMFGVVQITAA